MSKTLVVVPYRDREKHLQVLTTAFLERYITTIPECDLCVVEQAPGKDFNRGLTKNIGGIYAKDHGYKYIIFNDVDCIPGDWILNNIYTNTDWDACRIYNAHKRCFGGVMKLTTDSFHICNGFPSDIWQWGVEDRALYYRYVINSMSISPWKKTRKYMNVLNHVKARGRVHRMQYGGGRNNRSQTEANIYKCGDKKKQLEYIQKSGINTSTYETSSISHQHDGKIVTLRVEV